MVDKVNPARISAGRRERPAYLHATDVGEEIEYEAVSHTAGSFVNVFVRNAVPQQLVYTLGKHGQPSLLPEIEDNVEKLQPHAEAVGNKRLQLARRDWR